LDLFVVCAEELLVKFYLVIDDFLFVLESFGSFHLFDEFHPLFVFLPFAVISWVPVEQFSTFDNFVVSRDFTMGVLVLASKLLYENVFSASDANVLMKL